MAVSLADILASLDNGVRAINNATVAIDNGITAISCVAASVSSLSGVLVEYTTGSWTPDVTFATSGDTTFTYTAQIGRYVKIGSLVTAFFTISGDLTHSTSLSTGNLQINGLPFAVGGANANYPGSLDFNTITPSTNGYTHFVPEAITATSRLQIIMNSNIGGIRSFVTSTSISSAAVGVIWRGTVPYVTA